MNKEVLSTKYKELRQFAVAICVHGILLMPAKAQQNFSLKQALDYAYSHSSKMQNAILDEKITDEKIKVVKGAGLPQVKASADFKYFPYVPTSVIPNFIAPSVASVLNSVDMGQLAQGKPRLFFPNDQAAAAASNIDNYPLIAASFGTKYSTSAGVNASWLVADASYFLALKAQKEVTSLMKYSTQRSKVEVAEAVSKAYYTAIISDKKAALLTANIDRLDRLLSETKEYNKQGFVEKIDVDRLQLAYNNLKTEYEKVAELVELSKSVLKFQMNFPIENKIILTDSISDNSITSTMLDQSFIPESRLEFQQLSKLIDLTRLQLKAREWAWIPNVVAIGSLSTLHAANKVDFYYNPSFNNYGAKYYPTGLLGVSVGATLFDGLQNKHEKEQLRLKIKQNENDALNLKNALLLETSNSKTILRNATLNIASQKSNIRLAEEVVRVTKIKYQQGVGSNLEVLNAETSLKEAQTNYLAALYDAYIAKVNYEKAIGTLVKF